MKSLISLGCLLVGMVSINTPTNARELDDVSRLTLQRIFTDREFAVKDFSGRWLSGSVGYTLLEKSPGDGRDIVLYDPETNGRETMVSAEHLIPPGRSAPLEVEDYAFSEDRSLVLIYTNSRRVWRRNTRGDYWLLDRSSRVLRKLGGDAPSSTFMFAKISPSGNHAAYVRDRNIYLEDLHDHSIRQLTQTPSSDIINGTFDWVYEEEFGLRDGFRFSPDGASIAFWRINTSGVREFPLINNTDRLYPRVTKIKYPKVGQKNPAAQIGVIQLHTDRTVWMKVPGESRNQYLARMDWAAGSHEILLQQLNRSQNTHRVMLGDARTGKVKTVITERDEAWLDVHDELYWLDKGNRFTWISERDGWRGIYSASRDGGAPRRLVCPGFDCIRLLHIDEEQKRVYFLASPNNPTQRYLYMAPLGDAVEEPPRRLTPNDQPGFHDYRISPQGRWAIHTFSSFGAAPVTELIRLPDHAALRVLEKNESLTKKLSQLRRGKSELFRVDIGEGVWLDGWRITPPGVASGSEKKYPLLVYVYGEPAGVTVLDRWGGDNYLWHLLMAQHGYCVMSFDNRGTPAPRGRAWRKCVYRQVGVLAPQDQAASVRAVLKTHHYLDARRVGVWGWSGGGSMTLNALFKYPELYHAGVAIAPVPNQRFYDTIYQERYMGLPRDNVEGFVQGSPINFAHQLQGSLLLIHGTGDDNCHYQTTEKLINELIRHNKPFTMMAYPNRTHSIREGKNTTRHLRELKTRFFLEKLPAGAVSD